MEGNFILFHNRTIDNVLGRTTPQQTMDVQRKHWKVRLLVVRLLRLQHITLQ